MHRWFLPLLFLVPAAGAQSLRVDVGLWDYEVSGSVRDGGEPLDLQEDLNVGTRNRQSYALATAAGPDWLPALAFSYSPIDVGGEQLIRSTVGFGPLILLENETTALIDADLRDLGLTAHGRVLGSDVLQLRAGLTLRNLEGPITVRDADDEQSRTEDIDEWFPQLHLAAQWRPTLRWQFGLAADGIESAGNRAIQLRAQADWQFLQALGISLGWQYKQFDVRSGSFELDSELDGVFGGLFLQF
jgi:outer membrane protein